MKVLVPAAGGAAGVGCIKSLKMSTYRGSIIATDADPLSPGFHLSAGHAVLPLSSGEDRFIEALIGVVKREKIQALMPTSQTDGYAYSRHRRQLEELGATPIISDTRSLDTCIDKMQTYKSLSGQFVLPFTTTDPSKVNEFPVIAKPRCGKGSRNIFKVDDEHDLTYVASKFKDMIFQEYLPGPEYTVDVLSDLRTNPLMAVARSRLETKAGISSKGKVVHNQHMEEVCMKIAQAIGIRGPCCIQMKESKNNGFKLVEVNPRLGGGTLFTTLAGANFPAMLIDMLEGKPVKIPQVLEITVIRYFEEIVIDEKKPSTTTILTAE
jgi:carbamoyl-phosphate synthase large subunit